MGEGGNEIERLVELGFSRQTVDRLINVGVRSLGTFYCSMLRSFRSCLAVLTPICLGD